MEGRFNEQSSTDGNWKQDREPPAGRDRGPDSGDDRALTERADGRASPGHPDRLGWSADLSLGAIRNNETEARGSSARVNGR